MSMIQDFDRVHKKFPLRDALENIDFDDVEMTWNWSDMFWVVNELIHNNGTEENSKEEEK